MPEPLKPVTVEEVRAVLDRVKAMEDNAAKMRLAVETGDVELAEEALRELRGMPG